MKRAKNYLIITGVTVLVLLVAGFILAGIFGVLLDVLYIAFHGCPHLCAADAYQHHHHGTQ